MFGTLFKEKSLISMVIHVDTTNGSNLMWFIMPCTMTLFGTTNGSNLMWFIMPCTMTLFGT